MENRPTRVWWYVSMVLRVFTALVVTAASFAFTWHWLGQASAVLISLCVLTMMAIRVAITAMLPRNNAEVNAQQWRRFGTLFIIQGIAVSVLVLTSIVLRLWWLSALFALWAAVSLMIWRVSRRRSSALSAEPREIVQPPKLRRRVLWVFAAAIPAFLTVGVLFAVGVIKFWMLLALIAVLAMVAGLVAVVVFISSYRRAT